MVYKTYTISIVLRLLILTFLLGCTVYGFLEGNPYALYLGAFFSVIICINLYQFLIKRFVAMDDFFESVKYRDFSRWFSEDNGTQDIRALHKGFNLVNKTIKTINNERQAQFVYLQKILEMVDVGIVAYNVETGEVLWINDSFLEILDFPSFKNVNFVALRQPHIFEELFETYHANTTSTTLKMKRESLKVLISDTVFEVEKQSFKLVVIQNIDDTLNQNESEAWKKLLSVMTHEIMNSIAPISSLAETLQYHIKETQEQPETKTLELDDLYAGISSIQKRSEGLMKFAQTYRSLNKVTKIHRTKISVKELFETIENLMRPTIVNKEVELHFNYENKTLELEIDAYLIEQVLINLILNAIDATSDTEQPKVSLFAKANLKGNPQIIITDNGKGIPEEVQESIFIPFFTTKTTGSGIGLSLCKQIMLLHQGKITLRSEEGIGTVFILQF